MAPATFIGGTFVTNGIQDHPASGGILSVGANALLAASNSGKDRVIGVAMFTDGSKSVSFDKTIRSFFYFFVVSRGRMGGFREELNTAIELQRGFPSPCAATFSAFGGRKYFSLRQCGSILYGLTHIFDEK